VLQPESIGIIGVSERMNLGRIILHNVLDAGFPPEAITVVKDGLDTIGGVGCAPDAAAMDPVDLLVVAIAADGVPDLVERVATAGTAGVVVLIPGGLGERPGSEGLAARIETVLAERDPGGGPLVIGGNCMGIRSRPGRYDTTFIPDHKMTPVAEDGEDRVAVISQSGAFVLSRLDRLPWLDPRYVVTLGNQIDVTVGDVLEHIADDPGVLVAACYVEGFRPGDGRRWLAAAGRLIARGGSVVLLRGGRTEAGARSAVTHTAALAGDPAVTRSLAAAVGVLVADTLDEFEDLLRLAVLLRDRRFGGDGLAVVSNAGFECVAAADALSGFTAASMTAATEQALGELLTARGLDGVVGVGNPLDLTPNMDDEGFVAAAAALLADPGVDAALVGCVPFTPALDTLPAGEGHDERLRLADRLLGLWGSTDKPWVAVVDGGGRYDPMARALDEGGVPTFRSVDRALRMLGRYAANRIR
jgi:acyl-CoA synthetase (NDP forming)